MNGGWGVLRYILAKGVGLVIACVYIRPIPSIPQWRGRWAVHVSVICTLIVAGIAMMCLYIIYVHV